MGGDGGTIPGRKDLVKEKRRLKQAHKVSFGQSKVSQWTHCALSNNRLTKPIVIDSLGNLFNKQDIVLTLFNKKMPRQLSHIKKIKRDVINVKPTIRSDIDSTDVDHPDTGGIFQCPITDLIANGKYPFIVLRQCGCLLSEKALKQVPSQTCLICGTPLDTETELMRARIPVNPSPEIKDTLRDMNLRYLKQYKMDRKSAKNDKIKSKPKSNPIDSDVSSKATTNDTLASAATTDDNNEQKESIKSNATKEDTTATEIEPKRKRKMSRAEKDELRKEIETKLAREKAKINPSVLGKRSLPEDVDRTVESQKKKSRVFASLFDDNRREYNFTGGGKGGL